jgi:putative ABC transport system permease protein
MFAYEAFILGLLGAVIRGAASLVMGISVVSAIIGTTAYYILPANIACIPEGMVVGMVVCLASGLYPAWSE